MPPLLEALKLPYVDREKKFEVYRERLQKCKDEYKILKPKLAKPVSKSITGALSMAEAEIEKQKSTKRSKSKLDEAESLIGDARANLKASKKKDLKESVLPEDYPEGFSRAEQFGDIKEHLAKCEREFARLEILLTEDDSRKIESALVGARTEVQKEKSVTRSKEKLDEAEKALAEGRAQSRILNSGDLGNALSEDGYSRAFLQDLSVRKESLDALEAQFSKDGAPDVKLVRESLDTLRLVEAGGFFREGGGAESDERRKKRRALINALHKQIEDFQKEIDESSKGLKGDDADALVLESARRYLTLAAQALDKYFYQDAANLFESAKALVVLQKAARPLEKRDSKATAGSDTRAGIEREAEGARDSGQPEPVLDDSAKAYAAARKKAWDLSNRHNELARLAESIFADERKAIAGLGAALAPNALVLVDRDQELIAKNLPKVTAPVKDFEELKTFIEEEEARLEKAEEILKRSIKRRFTESSARAMEIVKSNQEGVKQKNADLTGVGEVKTTSRADTVPQGVLQPLAAQLEAVRLLGEIDGFALGDRDLLVELEADIKRQVDWIEENRELFKQHAKDVKLIRYYLGDSAFGAMTAERDDFQTKLDAELAAVEKPGADVRACCLSVSKLHYHTEEALKKALEAEKSLEKYDKLCREVIKTTIPKYMKTMAKVHTAYFDFVGDGKKLQVKDGEEIKLNAKTMEKLKEAAESGRYSGMFTKDLDNIVAKYQRGKPGEVKTAHSEVGELKETIEEFITRLKKNLPLMKKGQVKENIFQETLPDLLASATETAAFDQAKNDYQLVLNKIEFELWVSKLDANQATKDVIESSATLVKALERRAKAAKTPEDMRALEKEAQELLTSSQDLIAANQLKASKKDPAASFKKIMARLQRGLDEFGTRMEGFRSKYVDPVENQAKDLRHNSEGEESKNAQAIRRILRDGGKSKTLNDFFTQVTKEVVLDKKQVDALTESMDKVQEGTGDLVAVREKASAMILRRRRFLEKTPMGNFLRSNPFDKGIVAKGALRHLEAAEQDLLAHVKH